MVLTYQLVLIEDIPKWQAKGWRLSDDRVHVKIGGWKSVYMEKNEKELRPKCDGGI